MKTFEIIIYDWNAEVEYERYIVECDTYGDLLTLAGKRCQEIMKEKDLQEVCWNYREVV